MSKMLPCIYKVKIVLQYSNPLIWRRILISSEITLAKLHHIIQEAMGWTNSHLHVFVIGSVRFMFPYEPDDLEQMTAIDTRCVKLSYIVPSFSIQDSQGKKSPFSLDYEYDLGDSWKHIIGFEERLFPDAKQKTPVCIDGARAYPLEATGGGLRYMWILQLLDNPEHPEYEHYSDWVGDDFDPEDFNREEINRRIALI